MMGHRAVETAPCRLQTLLFTQHQFWACVLTYTAAWWDLQDSKDTSLLFGSMDRRRASRQMSQEKKAPFATSSGGSSVSATCLWIPGARGWESDSVEKLLTKQDLGQAAETVTLSGSKG